MILGAAIDLGTMWIKGGRLRDDETLEGIVSRPAPPLQGQGAIRESSAAEYLAVATEVRDAVCAGLPPETRFGIASQRSTFLLWEAEGGRPLTPLISWQDRRATGWCERHRDADREIVRLAGLPLSPHYAGPKLAHLLEEDAELRGRAGRGELRFGTLETFVLWQWTAGRSHETDLTMAARTLLADPRTGAWCPGRLPGLLLHPRCLPRILPTAGRTTSLSGGLRLGASVADQAAATLPVVGDRQEAALVNLGTGGFILRPIGPSMVLRPGYLSGPILGRESGPALYALEGTINGAAAAADRFSAAPADLPEVDPAPDAFCLPDVAGVGSPHWLPERGFALSAAAENLPEGPRRRIVMEGILFRVREILEDLFGDGPPASVFLAGGLVRDRAVAPGLAACLGRPVELLVDGEATLLGAARLGAGLSAIAATSRSRTIRPARAGRYLSRKFDRWREWLLRQLA